MTQTRERIIQAAYALFETRPFESITVEEILSKAYVSRGTFYRHFQDKYELMYLYYSEFLNKNILAEFDGTNWESLQDECYRFGAEHKRFFRNMKNDSNPEGFWQFMAKVSEEIFRDIKCHNEKRTELTDIEKFIIQCYVNNAIFAFKQIVYDQTSLPVETISHLLYSTLPDDYKKYLD